MRPGLPRGGLGARGPGTRRLVGCAPQRPLAPAEEGLPVLVRLALPLCALLPLALRGLPGEASAPHQVPASSLHPPVFELVESAPVETTLDHPEIRNAEVVWVEMIQSAARTLDFAEFYAS